MNLHVSDSWKDELQQFNQTQCWDELLAERISARRCNIGNAICCGDIDLAVKAVESGRSISCISSWLHGSQTLLMQAIEQRTQNWDGIGRIISALITRAGMLDVIERGDFIDARDIMGRTAMFFAARAGDSSSIRSLLSIGADPRIADFTGTGPADIEGIEHGIRSLLQSATSARRLKL